MFGKRSIEVNAILDKDIENLLRETDQYEALLKGELKCCSCDTDITINNIGIIIPVNSDNKTTLKFYCERLDCAENYKLNNG